MFVFLKRSFLGKTFLKNFILQVFIPKNPPDPNISPNENFPGLLHICVQTALRLILTADVPFEGNKD